MKAQTWELEDTQRHLKTTEWSRSYCNGWTDYPKIAKSQGSGSSVGTKPAEHASGALPPLRPNPGSCAAGGTPAPETDPTSSGSWSKAGPNRQETTMNTELEEPESPVWGADWWREIYYGIVSLAALCCCGPRTL